MANFIIIKELARKRNLTLKKVSELLGITEQGLQQIMKNNQTNTSTLEKLSEILDVPVALFFDSGNNAINQTGGERNAASIYGNASTCDIENYLLKISHLETLLEEKEKQITLLNRICEIQNK